MFLIKAIAIWFVMVLAAMANGIFREKIVTVYLGQSVALPASGILLSVFILIIVYNAIDYIVPKKASIFLTLGVFWVSLTLMFEYGFGYFVLGAEISQINQVFNVSSGNLFVWVVVVTLLSPLLIAYLKGYIGNDR
ncbi:hypothetical protein G8770_09930 [Aestuariicella hydrocarbonica]|uniref:Uncharacterized protein n=1 Tax=Pseudomaricurvus hydrocarbonicus TaxID=1470433 RepID=A0A9E5JVW9_9GAMM|nr:hypothetical protein [Aestuariicella hydrocarbonica]NHO65860.1 hypothetical protein [Aestuariicella hydrocarbonica]